jgi:hypothetical protein
MARLHRIAVSPVIPDIADEDLTGPHPWLALDCDGIADMECLAELVRQGSEKTDLKRGSVVGKTLMEALTSCHQSQDPDHGGPLCLGSLSSSNLLFAADGRMWIVGFGAGPLGQAYLAPEVALGEMATPGADVYALTLFMRAHMQLVQLPSAMRRVFCGRSWARDAKALLLLVWSNLHILSAAPSKRPDMGVALAKARAMWKLFGFEPDVAGFAAWVARTLTPAQRERARIRMGRDGEWLEAPDGNRYALNSRKPLRRILWTLAQARRDGRGEAVSVTQLLEAGWPGESPVAESGCNRVYVAISSLRKLGLGEALQRWDGGYRLDPGLPCELAEEA